MGFFRFRKSFKIVPGIRLNVSKTGTSWSIGPRGAKLNFKDGKVRGTAGIPGTGLSYTSQLCGSSPESEPAASLVGSFVGLVWSLIQLAVVVGLFVFGLTLLF